MVISNIQIERAIRKAFQSNCRYRVSALAFSRKGDFIGSATNQPRFDRFHGGLHAEKSIITKFGKRIKTIIICRTGSKGDLLPIHPCVNCKKLAKKYGITIRTIKNMI